MRLLAAALLALLTLSPSFADTAAPGDAGRAQALQLALAWVTHHTGHASIPPVRAAVVLTPEAMAAQAAKLYPAQQSTSVKPMGDVFALASCADRTLYFRNDA